MSALSDGQTRGILDSDYSWHIKGNKSLFTSFEYYKVGKVTFSYGESAKICGKVSTMCNGMPKLDDVLYIAGLKAILRYILPRRSCI